MTYSHTHTYRQTDRQTDRQADRQTGRKTDSREYKCPGQMRVVENGWSRITSSRAEVTTLPNKLKRQLVIIN